jgi:hypothetical protein
MAAIALGQTPLPDVGNSQSKARWVLNYLYDEDDSELVLTDLKFPSALRGIASGAITGNKEKNVVLVTSDGGKQWSIVPVKETGQSLFFLNESTGWMVTSKGIWKTLEAGRSWKKQPSPKSVRRVYFLSEQHGLALCAEKSVYETKDGGLHWEILPISQEPKANPDHTAYETVDFAGPRGMITGWSNPPRQTSRLPDWMEPEKSKSRREWPTLNILLETTDEAKTWKMQTAPIFGRIARLNMAEDGRGLALLEFRNSFEVPSEVISIDTRTVKSIPVYRKNDRRVTDLLLVPDTGAYLAAIETPPQLPHSPLPGRLRILHSGNLSNWQEMDVDYRASGTRAILAGAGSENLWVATDQGAILKLSAPPNK